MSKLTSAFKFYTPPVDVNWSILKQDTSSLPKHTVTFPYYSDMIWNEVLQMKFPKHLILQGPLAWLNIQRDFDLLLLSNVFYKQRDACA